MSSEEETLKKRMLEQRMAEQQSAMMQAQQQSAQAEAVQQQVKQILAKFMDPKARERLATLKMTKPELAIQIEIYLAQLYQAGQIRHISDEQLVEILKKTSEKREIKITRK